MSASAVPVAARPAFPKSSPPSRRSAGAMAKKTLYPAVPSRGYWPYRTPGE